MISFSHQMIAYHQGRPLYPLPFYYEALDKIPTGSPAETVHIWDCATGPNAAVTLSLIETLSSSRFAHTPVVIHATDIDAAVVAAAQSYFYQKVNRQNLTPNLKVIFAQAAAEVGPPSLLREEQISATFVGNALHWIVPQQPFYDTLCKRSKPDALLVAWTHPLVPDVPDCPELQEKLVLIGRRLRRCESPESRQYVSNPDGYAQIYWPFEEEPFGKHTARKCLTPETLGAYWDSVFQRATGLPLSETVAPLIKSVWPNPILPRRFEWQMRIRAARIGSYKPTASG